MAWVVPAYPRDQVNEAGRALADLSSSPQAKDAALVIVDNWRASHSYPLNTFQMTLRNKTREIDKQAIVAQRLKRLPSIVVKLRRFPSLNLSAMQDIGGCRAIVSSTPRVYSLRELYRQSDLRHTLVREKDYIAQPKESGYRGIHLVYAYVSEGNPAYNDLRIEMQFRTRLQHAWATAVETVGTFLQQALKSSEGEEEWLRFFKLMGSALALRERKPLVPGTPNSRDELVVELKARAAQLNVEDRLRSFGSALSVPEDPRAKGAHYFLLELRPNEDQLWVRGFERQELNAATAEYSKVEKAMRGTGGQAVLVSVDSLRMLKRAYPNYYLDTDELLDALERAIS